MFFKDIPGNNEVKSRLISTVTKGRIPHAQIFLGKEGAGGLPMALALASYIMCEYKNETDSCGHCNQCNKSHKFIHPDIHFSYPVVKFGDKKSADTTSDDFLPKWREILTETPFMGTTEWLQHIDAENNLPNINGRNRCAINRQAPRASGAPAAGRAMASRQRGTADTDRRIRVRDNPR